ncbi:MAG: rhomboid family intramembrane serine protease [Erysipelotrichales bacterium]|nr:rhomboid family intramembrane serine protease [Erysipelotrichales bacterium]MBQ1386672.1 rhomboid family intramembrane serine protease [Erysipelotrichales bacterium]MBQ2310453.1 rhomboid family intramembrane serine protease [Erysipelotrichales bacterium]
MRKISWNSPVILWFVFICTAALGLNYLTGGKSNRLVFEVYRSSLKDPLFYVRLFGHIFGHVNFAHFANNMMYILLLGPIVEEKYGSKNLVLLMAVTAVVTGLVQVLLFPRTALLGASGIVFLLIMMSAVVGEGKDIPLTLILVVVVYFGNQIAEGLVEADKVSQLTHIIGGVIGLAGGWRLTRR